MTDDLLPLDRAGGDAGGKAAGLARLLAAGLPVPPGFCVTAAAHRRHAGAPPDVALAAAVAAAYRELGKGPVAVRSSAADEDGDAASFAGQQETVLGVEGADAVVAAGARCWASLRSARADAYRDRQAAGREPATGVVVQTLVPAEVAGVLFTRDPLDPTSGDMLAEASWGLGESVVSGRVAPDRFRLDRATGAARERHVGDKATEWTPAGPRPVPPERRGVPCLGDDQLSQLAELGRRVEDHFGSPRDVEWAWAGGQFWLLQARPITAAGTGDRDAARRDEIDRLRALAEGGHAVWVRINLSESLPEATPMTWAVVQRRLMAGTGGLGLMMRDLGYRPSPAVADLGAFDLVAGRVYCNLAREPRMSLADPPVWHDPAAYKADPARAAAPRADLKPLVGWRAFWRLFTAMLASGRAGSAMRQARRDFASRFRERVLPPFLAEVEKAKADDLSQLTPAELVARFEHWTRRTLGEFARESLKATALLEFTRQELRTELSNLNKQPGGADRAIGELAAGAGPEDYACDLGDGVRALAAGKLAPAAFLDRFGHRGDREMELASPRWGEDAASPARLAARAGGAGADRGDADWRAAFDRIAADPAVVPAGRRPVLEAHVKHLRTLTGLREEGKHHFLRGYALMRAALVELGRRTGLGDGIFFLLPEELPRLAAGDDLSAAARDRRRRHQLLLSLPLPAVLFGDDLDAVGRPAPVPPGADALHGVALAAGVAEGPALVLRSPDAAAPAEGGYVLVCPSTDPAWVPLFVRAAGLVMETGGVLSHGAIVAREFGLPAVAGLPGVLDRLAPGTRVRVDGSAGTVTVLPGGPG